MIFIMLFFPAILISAIVVGICYWIGLSTLAIWGFGLVSWGITQFVIGWQFNSHTPLQQSTPAWGVVVMLIGIGCLLLSI